MSLSIAQEIHYLSNLACVPCGEWRHQVMASNFEVQDMATPQTILTFTVPPHQSWFVTQIDLEAFNPSPVGTSDFRSEQIDYNGLTNAWLTVNGNPSMAANSIASSALFNRPVLFVFKGGDRIDIIVQRDAGSLPASAYQIQVAVNGYFTPASANAKVTGNTTNIQKSA